MRKENMPSDGGFTQLFIIFIVIFVGIGLLTHNVNYTLLPIFGFAIGLLKKGIKVNIGIRIVLLIFSIAAIGLLSLWVYDSMRSILAMTSGLSYEIESAYMLPHGTFFILWFMTQLLPTIVLVVAGFLAAILSPNQKRMPTGSL